MGVQKKEEKRSVFTPPQESVTVDKVHVDGIVETADEIIREQVKPLFRVLNYEVLTKELKETVRRLKSLNAFSTVGCLIDPYNSKVPHGKYHVYFDVKEKPPWNFFLWPTFPLVNHPSVNVGVDINNLYGKCRTVTIGGSHVVWSASRAKLGDIGVSVYCPSKTNALITSQFGIGYSRQPLGLPHDSAFYFKANMRLPVADSDISYHELKTGIFSDATFGTNREDSAIQAEHCFVRDTRVSLDGWPVSGNILTVRNTFQMIGLFQHQRSGSAQEVTFSGFLSPFPRFPSVTFCTSLRMAMMQDHCAVDLLSPIDGPGGVRGTQSGSINGCYRAAAALHCYFPWLPKNTPFLSVTRGHLFATCGNAHDEVVNCVKGLGIQCSTGAGISAALEGICHIEANLCIPHDSCGGFQSPRFQIGVGANFL